MKIMKEFAWIENFCKFGFEESRWKNW
jgi:hypothetical protein